MRDLNYGEIDWLATDATKEGKDFLNLCNDCFLTQHVTKPTREHNILDLILSMR